MIFTPFDVYDFTFIVRKGRHIPSYDNVVQRIIVLEQQRAGGIDRIRVAKLDEKTKEVVFCWLSVFERQKDDIKKVGHLEIEEVLTSDIEALRQCAKKYFETMLEEDLI